MIITFGNNKGGSGKSSISAHVAAALAAFGRRVGYVDSDPQGHGARVIGYDKADGLYELLVNNAPFDQVVIDVPPERYPLPSGDVTLEGRLFVIPSSNKTFTIPLAVDDVFLFGDRMAEFAATYALDVIVVDTKPSTDLLDSAIYMATDGFIFVTELEDLSFDGVMEIWDKVEKNNQRRTEAFGVESAILGIVANKVRGNTWLHRLNASRLGEAYGKYVWSGQDEAVLNRVTWPEAVAAHELLFTYAPDSQAAQNAWAVARRTLSEVIDYAKSK